jgi:hypothetical protein
VSIHAQRSGEYAPEFPATRQPLEGWVPTRPGNLELGMVNATACEIKNLGDLVIYFVRLSHFNGER